MFSYLFLIEKIKFPAWWPFLFLESVIKLDIYTSSMVLPAVITLREPYNDVSWTMDNRWKVLVSISLVLGQFDILDWMALHPIHSGHITLRLTLRFLPYFVPSFLSSPFYIYFITSMVCQWTLQKARTGKRAVSSMFILVRMFSA